jgi:hypothetical protein
MGHMHVLGLPNVSTNSAATAYVTFQLAHKSFHLKRFIERGLIVTAIALTNFTWLNFTFYMTKLNNFHIN